MADHHPEAILKLLTSWQTVLNRQAEVLEQGNTEDLMKLVRLSSAIQQQLQGILPSSDPNMHGKMVADLLKSIHKQQAVLIRTMKCRTEELAQEMGALQRNKTSLKGYKQKKTSIPRFMSEHT